MPGVGGTTATFVAYAAARQTSGNPETFGQGRIEGVIAPEAAKNAEEGGALVPTLALGIPGSASMAMLLGALLDPRPAAGAGVPGQAHGSGVWRLAIICALANFAASFLMFLLSQPPGLCDPRSGPRAGAHPARAWS